MVVKEESNTFSLLFSLSPGRTNLLRMSPLEGRMCACRYQGRSAEIQIWQAGHLPRVSLPPLSFPRPCPAALVRSSAPAFLPAPFKVRQEHP